MSVQAAAEDALHVVIGGGVVGLAVAARLAACAGGSTLLLEKCAKVGMETSSRNSEVVHSGIYYPPASLKTRLCIRGRHLLYETCERHGVPHRRLGKWIVAQDDEEAAFLSRMHEKAASLGVPTRFLSEAERQRDEPLVRCKEALLSPETGIVDSHALMMHLEGAAEAAGGAVVTGTEVTRIERDGDSYLVHTKQSGDEDFTLRARTVVNCAGLHADKVARAAMGEATPPEYRLRLCRGIYFGVSGPAPVRRLVYPCPEHNLAGLGVHATLDMGGRMRLGPDVEYVDAISYEVDEGRRNAFWKAALRYLPSLRADQLFPDYAGIRPKLSGPGEAARDFVIAEESARGFPGLVNLVGIESPGLTSALAIAEVVAEKLGYPGSPPAP
eukprot:tig00020603_g11776.t1